MKLAAVIGFCFLILAGGAQAEDLGPEIGAVIPHDLTATTSAGVETNFADLVGEKGLALFFVRSVDWCPFCRAQAVDVNGRMAAFEERRIKVAFVSYDVPAKQQPFVEKWRFTPAMISDDNIEIINAFGIRNEDYAEGSRFYGIPHPAVFIINKDKTVAAKLYEEDFAVNSKSYRERPEVDTVLATIDEVFGE